MENKELNSDLSNLFSAGPEQVHVLADFDGTLTQEYVAGKKTPSLISILRDNPDYLSPVYSEQAHALHKQYSPFEKDTTLSLTERKARMQEWWTKHKQLLIDSGLRRQHLEDLANSGIIQWRPGAVEFLQLMSQHHVPVVILSASGLGDVIPIYCQSHQADFPNIHYIVNRFIWDEQGRAKGYHQPMIHSLNKDETVVQDFSTVYAAVQARTRVLLLGNNLGDLGMVEGFPATQTLSIGFLDQEESSRAPDFSGQFNHVVVERGFTDINRMIQSALKN